MAVSEQKKNVALGIIDFLKTSIEDGTVSADDQESVDVAIECVSDVFGVNMEDKPKVFGDENLVSLYERFSKLQTNEASEDDNTSSSAGAAASNTASEKVEEVSEEDKKEAETYKVEGNRAMGQRKFQDAVEQYTKAIEKNPNNEIYWSNRSAAYSSLRECNKAVDDAKKALEINKSYPKAYSRLGLALYSLGDAQGAMKAYEDGIKAEGDNPSDGMRRGYETAKKRVQEELEASVPSDDTPQGSRSVNAQSADGNASASATGDSASASASGGGFPDLSGLGNLDMNSIMNNPQIANMARNMMNNPNVANMMNEPSLQNMMSNVRNGEMPDYRELMNNPMIQNMASSLFGGGAGGGNNTGESGNTNNNDNNNNNNNGS